MTVSPQPEPRAVAPGPAVPPRPRGPGWLLALLVLAAATCLAAATATQWARAEWTRRLSPTGVADQAFEVRRGEQLATIATRLAEAGLIHDPTAFRLRARQRELDRKLQAGWYELRGDAGVDGLLDQLTGGRTAWRQLTIPEGLRLEQVAERVEAAGLGSAEAYRQAAAKSAAGFAGLPAGATLEGYLFPDTYRLGLTDGPAELVTAQLRRFEQVYAEVTANQSPPLPRHELVTVASIVEREARLDSERARVAGVFYNRLTRGQKLESCATVIYALGEHRDVLLYRDLEVRSPYNTYRHAGLPPGPIASPGRASLAAAVAPEQHDYYFFVLGEEGRHVFSRNGAEHQRAVARTRAKR